MLPGSGEEEGTLVDGSASCSCLPAGIGEATSATYGPAVEGNQGESQGERAGRVTMQKGRAFDVTFGATGTRLRAVGLGEPCSVEIDERSHGLVDAIDIGGGEQVEQ